MKAEHQLTELNVSVLNFWGLKTEGTLLDPKVHRLGNYSYGARSVVDGDSVSLPLKNIVFFQNSLSLIWEKFCHSNVAFRLRKVFRGKLIKSSKMIKSIEEICHIYVAYCLQAKIGRGLKHFCFWQLNGANFFAMIRKWRQKSLIRSNKLLVNLLTFWRRNRNDASSLNTASAFSSPRMYSSNVFLIYLSPSSQMRRSTISYSP